MENRGYFNGGRMFRWLGYDKKIVPPDSVEFKEQAERIVTDLGKYRAALSKNPANAKAEKNQFTQGTFLGVEQGDYAHWKMRTRDGAELSYFILRPDSSVEKVLQKPTAYVGRECRVHWKTTTENLPEAGGRMPVDHVVRVEWLSAR